MKAKNCKITIEGPEGRLKKPDKISPNIAHKPPRNVEKII